MLRELAPAARKSQEVGFTQPRDHLIARLCILSIQYISYHLLRVLCGVQTTDFHLEACTFFNLVAKCGQTKGQLISCQGRFKLDSRNHGQAF